MADPVGFDHHRTEVLENTKHRRFAAPDTTTDDHPERYLIIANDTHGLDCTLYRCSPRATLGNRGSTGC